MLRLTEIAGSSRRTLSILTPFDRPRSLDCQPTLRIVRPRRWLHDLDRAQVVVHPFGALAGASRSSMRVLPYQLEPALAVLGGQATRLLIADAVGLGKTIQAGLILRELARDTEAFRALVLVPAGLRQQWASELTTHFSLDSTQADASWLGSRQSVLPPDVNPWSLPGLYIASHDFVKRPESLKPLEQVTWSLVVVDEAHAASSLTDRRAALDAIASRAVRVVLLTATPHHGDSSEFASLCRIGRLDEREGPILVFARSRSDVGTSTNRRTVILPVTPSDAELTMHRLLASYSVELWRAAAARQDDGARLASIILRKRALSSAASLAASARRRLDLLSDVPAPDADQLRLPLADEDPLGDEAPTHALGAPGLADVRREKRWLQTIAEAARTAARSETKTRWLLRFLDRVREPVIVFTEYRDTLTRLHERIAATGRAVALLHGGLNPAERSLVPALLRRERMVLLATDAASEGLNLHQHCRIVVHYELPWHPARLEQRAGRVDRIGQSKRVHEIALVAASTAERLVIAPLTIRALRGRASGCTPLAESLTESRVAEAVMGGAPWSDEPDIAMTIEAETFQLDLRLRAEAEAVRIECDRVQIARSEGADARRRYGRPTATVLVRKGESKHRRPGTGLTLVYSIALEDGDERRVHAQTVTVHLTRRNSVRPRTPDQVRALVLPFVGPEIHEFIVPLQQALRSAIDIVGPLIRQAQQRLDERRRLIAALHRSRAMELVQPDLFRRRTQGTAVVPPDPSSSIELSLTARVTLLSALVVAYR
jgi:superfamily II DNA or RNA helicase